VVFLETYLDEVFADAVGAKFVTAGFDPHGLGCRTKAESPRDAINEQGGVFVFEFNHLAAVDADEMIVIGGFEKVGVVNALVAAEVDLAQEAAFDKKRNGAINGGSRSFWVDPASFFEKLFSGEMIIPGKGGFHNDIALRSSAQPALLDEGVEAFFDFCVHSPLFSQKNGF